MRPRGPPRSGATGLRGYSARPMNAHAAILTATLAACTLGGVASAQTSRVVPPFYATVEGNSRYTYPFGRDQAAMQLLIDRSQLTAGNAVVTAVAFRPEGSTTAAFTGYSKTYKLTVWTTTVAAAAMTIDPIANAANQPATVVFHSVLNVPSAPPLSVLPSAFTLRVPFANGPYPYASAMGSLLLQVDTADTVVPPGSWNVDAASLRTTTAEGSVTLVATGCQNGSNDALGMTIPRNTAIVGGSIDLALKTSSNGAFPLAVGILGARTLPAIDLGVVGMSGCSLHVEPLLTQSVNESAGAYPTISWPLPNLPLLQGLALFAQTLGWANPPSTLMGSVTSDASAVIVGPTGGWSVDAQSIFYVASTSRWSMGSNVAFFPVVSVEGVFP